MSEQLHMEDLFKEKLEGAEIKPSAESWKVVRRRYGKRDFFRFRPGRINAWYVGIFLIAGAGVLALNLREDEASSQARQLSDPVEAAANPDTDSKEILADESASEAAELIKREANGEESPPMNPEEEQPAESEQSKGTLSESASGPRDQDEQGRAWAVDVEDRDDPLEEPPLAYFNPSVDRGCAPLEVSFVNASSSALTFQWTFGDGQVSYEKDPVHVFEEPGDYKVYLRVYDGAGNSTLHLHEVEVLPGPQAAFEVEEGLKTDQGLVTVQVVNYSRGASSYLWTLLDAEGREFPGWSRMDFQPELELEELPEGSRDLLLIASSEDACTDTLRKAIPLARDPDRRTLKFATAFEASHTGPRGGHYNMNEKSRDIFHPIFTEEPVEYRLQIFSRLGERVFESRDLFQGWDGYVQQVRAAGGVYLWICEGKWADGEQFTLKGDVTLFWSDQRWP